MCPLRFILVFFSAILAGYIAWRTIQSSTESDTQSEDPSPFNETHLADNHESNLKKKVQDKFWVLVDMASGRYLWKNLKELKDHKKAKSI